MIMLARRMILNCEVASRYGSEALNRSSSRSSRYRDTIAMASPHPFYTTEIKHVRRQRKLRHLGWESIICIFMMPKAYLVVAY